MAVADAGDGALDEVEVLGTVHRYRDLPGGAGVGGQLGEGGAVGGGVGHEDVAQAGGDEPEGFGQGEGHDPGEAVHVEDAGQDRPGADRFAGDPDGLAVGAPGHVGGVRAQGREVEHGEGGSRCAVARS
nr:hypothetical protein GCM10020093_098620 [Planobispora longispora]